MPAIATTVAACCVYCDATWGEPMPVSDTVLCPACEGWHHARIEDGALVLTRWEREGCAAESGACPTCHVTPNPNPTTRRKA